MESVTHDQAAAELARAYAAGGDTTRRAIATTCEEQGVLAALVVLSLPSSLRAGFVDAMKVVAARSD